MPRAMSQARSFMCLVMVPAAAVVLAACGGESTSSASSPGSGKPPDDTARVTAPSSGPRISVDKSELSYDAAASAGAVRDDAVEVQGVSDLDTGGRTVDYTVTVKTAPKQTSTTANVAISGTCTTSGRAPATADNPLSVSITNRVGEVRMRVAVPADLSSCYVVVDAWIVGKPHTGSSLTATFRR